MTIDGSLLVAPITLSGNQAVRVMAINPGVKATVTALVIAYGRSAQGGGLYNAGIATLHAVHFYRNRATSGGGVYNLHQLTIDRSTFSANQGGHGNWWFGYGGGIVNLDQLLVTNSTFSENRAYDGGAINNAGTLTVTHSSFRQNTASYGGAISTSGENTLQVNDSAFISNQGYQMGGALFTSGPTIIWQSSFHANQASLGSAIRYFDDIVIYNSTFSANKASGDSVLTNGGAMRAFGAVAIYNSTFIDNEANSGVVAAYSGFRLYNSIIAHSGGPDCSITPTPNVHNLIADGSCAATITGDPRLGPLQPSNELHQVYPLLPDSPAIDAGDNATCQATDQVGLLRPVDGNSDGVATCDIGAVERYPITASVEVYLQGNQQWIGNDDNTPDLADHTDFGQTTHPSEQLTRTFVISNLGAIDLTDLHVTIRGEGADAFQLTQPPSQRLVAGNSSAFQLRFYSPTLGAHHATVVLQGNGDPTPLYTFAVVGRDCRPALTVTSNADSGPGSVRQAIADLCPGGAITFAADLAGQTLALQQPLTLDKNLTVDGATLANAVTLSGNNEVRVLNVMPNTAVTLDRLIIADGRAPDGYGGGIHNLGQLTITNSTIMNNFAPSYLTDMRFPPYALGGGIYNGGRLLISNSTFTGNDVEPSSGLNMGGAIYSTGRASGTLTVTNSTFSNNGAHSGGGLAGTAVLYNTIIADSTRGSDCASAVVDNSSNLIEDGSCGAILTGDPMLGPLLDRGGGIVTQRLLYGSPAIDTGDNTTCLPTDQQGVARPLDGNGDGLAVCDLGAVEAPMIPTSTPTAPVAVAPTPTTTPTATPVDTVTPLPPPTPTATPTSERPPCPHGASVEPLFSPTDQLSQTIVVNAPAAATVQVTTISGTFDAVTTDPYQVPITLLPNQSHPLTVRLAYNRLGGSPPIRCQEVRTVDKLGATLVIVQQPLPTPIPTAPPPLTLYNVYLPLVRSQ